MTPTTTQPSLSDAVTVLENSITKLTNDQNAKVQTAAKLLVAQQADAGSDDAITSDGPAIYLAGQTVLQIVGDVIAPFAPKP